MPKRKKKLTDIERCLVELWRKKIAELPAPQKRALADRLGISYFTMMGKVYGCGSFTEEQIKQLKEYRWEPWTDGQSQELDGTELDPLFEDDDE